MDDTDEVFAALHRALPAQLFTVTLNDGSAGVFRRLWTSDPVAYPVPGVKPMTGAERAAALAGDGGVFVANDPEGFRDFPDHAAIVALGCGSVACLPVRDDAGWARGTVNLLDVAGYFTPARLAACAAEVAARRKALVSAMVLPR
ncbi:MAG: hypothetical protein RLZZ528_2259 [Pseudomonadota bacterium]